MMHVELPVGAFIAAVLVLVPLPWHWRARNVPTLSIIAWLFVSNVAYGVNAIIWANNVNIVVPVWCDITTKLQIGATMALPACCLCLCIHLERIASVRQASMSLDDKRRRMLFDCLMCWGIPMIYMALHYIVQGHRFDIVENLGCRPSIFTSIESVFIIWVPPSLVVLATLFFAGLALRHFLERRITFARHLQDSNSALTASVYFRLISMAVVQMVWGSLVLAVNVWFTCRPGLRPWISWADVHFNFSRIGVFPEIFLPEYVIRATYFSWWTIPASSLLFFIFFAFGQDAMKEYSACFRWIRRTIFRKKDTEFKKYTASNSIPKHVNLSTKASIASSHTLQRETDFKSPSDFELSSPKKSLSDASSSIYSPTATEVPSSSWSESFPTPDHAGTFITPNPHTLPPRYESV